MDLRSRRELNNGFGDALARAFELVLTPVMFAGLGWLLDGWLGTRPFIALALFAFTAVYVAWKLFARYDAEMRRHEERLFGPRQDGSQ